MQCKFLTVNALCMLVYVAVPEWIMELISNQLNAGSSPVSDAIMEWWQNW